METLRNLTNRFAEAIDLHEQFSRRYIEENRCILLEFNGRNALIGVCNPEATELLDELQSSFISLHRETEIVKYCRIEYSELLALLGTQSVTDPVADGEGRGLVGWPGGHDGLGAGAFGSADLDAREDSGPIVSLVNTVFLEAMNREVSDIHISSSRTDTRIRFREHGAMTTYRVLPRSQFEPIVLRIKHLAGLNILERRQPQDGRLTITLERQIVDARISTVPTVHGESLVLRLLNQRSVPLDFRNLGFVDSQVAMVEAIIRNTHGLLLVTGPTGSGKTTTLHTILNTLKQGSTKQIVAIEDPVEIESDGVEQIQVNESIGLNFASLLRRVLRQDPDIIMVGEIRDAETAELAIRAALTGHLVLSTVHTNSALPSVDRLRDMGIDSYLLAATLRGIISQQLVPVLCNCGRESGPSCPQCRGSGISGRQVIAELVQVDGGLAAGIHEGLTGAKLEDLAKANHISFSNHIKQILPDLRRRLVLPQVLR